jgi:hypothetical protein
VQGKATQSERLMNKPARLDKAMIRLYILLHRIRPLVTLVLSPRVIVGFPANSAGFQKSPES